MPSKATKAIPLRAASDRTCTVSQKVITNALIAVNYRNKHVKHPTVIENSLIMIAQIMTLKN